jgi:hypothetical protein
VLLYQTCTFSVPFRRKTTRNRLLDGGRVPSFHNAADEFNLAGSLFMPRQKRKSVLELRRMQIMAEVGAENNSTTVIMMPAQFRKSVKVSARQGSPFRARRVSNPWTRLCVLVWGHPLNSSKTLGSSETQLIEGWAA